MTERKIGPLNRGRAKPRHCNFCGDSFDEEAHEWLWRDDVRYEVGGLWKCRLLKRTRGRESRTRLMADPVYRERQNRYQGEYIKANRAYGRFKAYRHNDNKLGRECMSWAEAKPIMASECTYCGLSPSNGLDRQDNDRGHAADNVVSCCTTCNDLLGDLPPQAKIAISERGIRAARREGLLDTWTPPRFRNFPNLTSEAREKQSI